MPFPVFRFLKMDALDRIGMMMTEIPRVAQLLIFPTRLSGDYSPVEVLIPDGFDPIQLPGLFICVGLLALAIVLRRRAPVASFGMWWLMLSYLPVSNLLIWLKLRSPGAHPVAWLKHLAAASIAISGIYMLLFLPLAPLGAIATLFLGFGLLPLTPLIAFFAAIRANSKLSATMRGGAPLGPGFLLGLAALALPAGWDWATHSLLIRAAGSTRAAEHHGGRMAPADRARADTPRRVLPPAAMGLGSFVQLL